MKQNADELSLPQTVDMVSVLRKELMKFPEVNGVLSQTGRSNDGTDPSGFYYVQMQVNLKPKENGSEKFRWTTGGRDGQAIKKLPGY